MKRLIALFILVLMTASPAFALFCRDCGTSIPDDSKFCSQCGKTQGTTVVSTAAPAPTIPVVTAIPAQDYLVTSEYIMIEGRRVQRGQPILVLDVRDGRARIRVKSGKPCEGWVSVIDLHHRSTWKLAGLQGSCFPTYPSPKVVIITGKSRGSSRERPSRHDHGHGRDRRHGGSWSVCRR
jgi:hypothetical protein